ncbi:alpha/beta hydrolase [Streptomyces tricolor]|nr:alpha/beta hydrolase [Streptomyces tricolor]
MAPVRVGEGERLRSVGLPGVTLSVRSRRPAREGLPPALYVHGLGGSSQNWSSLMAELDGVVDSEAVDLPGFGDSPPPDDGDYSVTGHARAVIRYLDAAGRGPVHLFGNSLGGAVTTRVAAVRPDLVRTLTLVSPAPARAAGAAHRGADGTARRPRHRRPVHPAHQGVDGRAAGARGHGALLRRPRAGLAGGVPACRGGAGAAAATAVLLGRDGPLSRAGSSTPTRSAASTGCGAEAERVLAPTLLIYGGRDQLVGFRMAAKAARAFRDSPSADPAGRRACGDDGVPGRGGRRLPGPPGAGGERLR